MIALGPNIRLPEPVATRRGSLTARLPGGGAALYRFVAGVPAPLSDQASLQLLETIGAAAAEVHSLTSRLTVPVADSRPGDDRRVRWMRHTLSSLSEFDSRRVSRLTRVVSTRRMGVLREQLDRLLDHRRRLLPPLRQVLRHGDLQGDNLRVDGSSALGILDWDEAALDAPEREFGLLLLDGGRRVLDHVLNSYVRTGGVTDLDLDRIELAALERHLVDLAARFERALVTDGEQASQALLDLASWGVVRVDRLREYLARADL
jgi:aminoglycoside phosphotransferase (APT) family kinase protein